MDWKDERRACAAALSFLTRMGCPRMVEDRVLALAVRYYALAGLAVGLLAAGAVCLAWLAGARAPWPLAWLYCALLLWITRGLHLDGVADVGDAWGSGAQGEDFWRILRDSRLGAFGAMTLAVAFSGLLLGAQVRMGQQAWLVLLLAPVYGRVLAVLLAFAAPPYAPQSLGGKACAGATARVAAVYAAVGLACLTALPGADRVVTLAATLVLLWTLRRLALRQGGLNGDFLGTAIVGGEVFFLLSW